MSRDTKAQARQTVEVYGTLLQERAVISDIETEEVRGEQQYRFTVFGLEHPYEVVCSGIKETALVLSNMFNAYLVAYRMLGVLE